MSAAIVILLATIAAVFTFRREEDAPPQFLGPWTRIIFHRLFAVRIVFYWLFTVVVAYEMAAGGLWDLLRIEYVRVALAQLGYPLYLLIILGVWRIPGALVLLAPRFPRLKEWAYAGAFFNYTGAAASHLLADHTSQWRGPLIFSILTLFSWALRPASRRMSGPTPTTETRVLPWAVPVVIVAAMMAVAFITLPKGAPPPQ